MHNRSHSTSVSLHLPPSPSTGELKKRMSTEDIEDRKYRTRFSLQRVKVAMLGFALALILISCKRSLPRESDEAIETVSPFVAQADEDVKCKRSKVAHNNTRTYTYTASSVEKYIIDNRKSLGYMTAGADLAETCAIIRDETSPIYSELQQYFADLEKYNTLVRNFEPLDDLRLHFDSQEDKESACEATKLHKDGLSGLFKSNQVSTSSNVGIMEPLLPTMRSHKICTDFEANILVMDYLVHDFYSMCLQLRKHSRLIFIDMGASLDFHEDMSGEMPAIYIHSIYSKFGFKFDHIYAYEVNPKYPSKVFEAIPDELQSSWHWINVGVDARPCAKMNPFTMLANSFSPDDFVVVKLDIDTPLVEAALVEQLRGDPTLLQLVDEFYFEHHVHQKELSGPWTGTMEGSVGASLELMSELRKNGVSVHYWP